MCDRQDVALARMEVRPDAEVASETSRTRRWATRGRSRSATSNIKPAAAFVTGLFVSEINAADVDLRRASICFATASRNRPRATADRACTACATPRDAGTTPPPRGTIRPSSPRRPPRRQRPLLGLALLRGPRQASPRPDEKRPTDPRVLGGGDPRREAGRLARLVVDEDANGEARSSWTARIKENRSSQCMASSLTPAAARPRARLP